MKWLWFFTALLLAGCASQRSVGTSDSPAKPWEPPAGVASAILPANTASENAGRIAGATPIAGAILPANITPGSAITLP